MIAAPCEQIVEVADDADAHDVVVQRDVPEPALLVLGLQDERGPFILALIAIGAFEIGPDGALVQAPDPPCAVRTC